MKFFFLQEHGLYKIFKTIERVPNKKTIHIHIDPEHAFFENDRRAKQIKELLEKKWIIWLFIAKNQKAKNFFERNNLKYIFEEKHPIRQALHAIKLFMFDIKRFHLHAIEKKNYIFFVVFGAEFVFIFAIIFWLYALIMPSANIQITPTYQIENITYNFRYYPIEDTEYPSISRYLSIPFYSWYIDHYYELSISANNIRHIQNPSAWTITIYNPTDEELKLIANTRFITDEWLFFKAIDWFTIPAGTKEYPWETTIKAVAMDFDNNNIIMWTRGNIQSGTKLWIRNLTKSFFTKEIYAIATVNFEWWSSISTWFLTKEDNEILTKRLQEYIEQNILNILTKNFNDNDAFFLNFKELIAYEILDINIDNHEDQEQPILKWSIRSRIHFPYVKRSDFEKTINTHTDQRTSEQNNIIWIDKNSLVFYNDIRTIENLFIIPTKISIIQWYNFDIDKNKIKDIVKTRIMWLSIDQAREILLSYPEISTARITIRPPWYTSIPKLKSRIHIRINTRK
jgi:hypothetical protein